MVVEPRQASPGAVWRWSGQALGLLARGFSFWVGLICLLCLSIFATQRFPVIGGMLALMAFFGSILIAGALDRPSTATLDGVFRVLKAHGSRVVLFAGIIVSTAALVWMLLLSKPGIPWWHAFYSEGNVVRVLSHNWYVALRQIFVYSAYALGLSYFGLNIPGLTSFFQFACSTLLGMPFREAYRMGAAGQMKNLGPMLGVGLLFIVLPVVTVLLFPPGVPLLYCFLGVTDNQVRAAAPALDRAARAVRAA